MSQQLNNLRMWLSSFAVGGQPIWDATFEGGSALRTLIFALEGDGVVAAGVTATPNAMLVRVSDAGSMLWEKQYTFGTEARTLAAHNDGTYTIGGTYNDGVMSRPWLARVDAQGELMCAGE